MDDLRETCLLAILEQGLKDPAGASLWYVQREVSDAGVNDRLVALALSSLVANEYIFQSDQFDQDVGESYSSFKLTDKGNRYILEQYRDLKEKEEIRLAQVKGPKDASSVDDDIPF